MSKALCGALLGLLVFTISCQQERYVQGQRIYQIHCQNCHMEDGKGMGELYPSIPGSTYLEDNLKDLACLILRGKRSDELATVEMPANRSLSEAELSNVVNYVVSKWGSKDMVSPREMKTYLSDCPL